jgi:anti-sigma factor RsiW
MGLRASFSDWVARRRETMECRAAVGLMTCYLEDTLDEPSRRRFEVHLNTCPACTAYLDQMRVTIAVLGRLEPERLAAEVRAELVSIYRMFHSALM